MRHSFSLSPSKYEETDAFCLVAFGYFSPASRAVLERDREEREGEAQEDEQKALHPLTNFCSAPVPGGPGPGLAGLPTPTLVIFSPQRGWLAPPLVCHVSVRGAYVQSRKCVIGRREGQVWLWTDRCKSIFASGKTS